MDAPGRQTAHFRIEVVTHEIELVGADAIGGMDRNLGGLIVANTTITRPPLRSAAAGETGGLSGAPLRDLALARLRDFRKATGGALPLIGVGGIATADDAWARIRAGASLVPRLSSAAPLPSFEIPSRTIRPLPISSGSETAGMATPVPSPRG